jgi:tetratricopeptide (TPR) repeat protein
MTEQRLSRKEIKHDVRDDAFRHGVTEGYEYVAGHRRLLLAILGGIVALVAVVVGIRMWLESRERAATELLGRAERVMVAPIVTSGAKPDDEAEPTFADEASRSAKATELLEALHDQHASSAPGAVAAIYLGRVRFDAGDKAGARELWQGFLDDHEDHMLAAGVRTSLLELDRADGKAQEVADRLRADLERDDKELPEDVILYELGRTLEQLDKDTEALEVYRRLGDEYPDSPYAGEAQGKVRELGPQGPMPELQLPS